MLHRSVLATARAAAGVACAAVATTTSSPDAGSARCHGAAQADPEFSRASATGS